MNDFILVGKGQEITRIPQEVWQAHLNHSQKHHNPPLAFMSEEHHLVRNFVVSELPRLGNPMPPSYISGQLGLSMERIIQVLDDLERNLFFLYRNSSGEVTWAYPVTVEATLPKITFNSGERLYAA